MQLFRNPPPTVIGVWPGPFAQTPPAIFARRGAAFSRRGGGVCARCGGVCARCGGVCARCGGVCAGCGAVCARCGGVCARCEQFLNSCWLCCHLSDSRGTCFRAPSSYCPCCRLLVCCWLRAVFARGVALFARGVALFGRGVAVFARDVPPGDIPGRIMRPHNVRDCVAPGRAGIPAGPLSVSYFHRPHRGLDFAHSGRAFPQSGLAPPRPPR